MRKIKFKKKNTQTKNINDDSIPLKCLRKQWKCKGLVTNHKILYQFIPKISWQNAEVVVLARIQTCCLLCYKDSQYLHNCTRLYVRAVLCIWDQCSLFFFFLLRTLSHRVLWSKSQHIFNHSLWIRCDDMIAGFTSALMWPSDCQAADLALLIRLQCHFLCRLLYDTEWLSVLVLWLSSQCCISIFCPH